MSDPWNLERFVEAQATTYASALSELRAGHKVGHWIWWIFPQLRGLGSSAHSTYYSLSGVPEAHAYYHHGVLGGRLLECVMAVSDHRDEGVHLVLGSDALKLRSCLTLFALAVPQESLFREVLYDLYEGHEDSLTVTLLAATQRRPR